LAPGQHKLTIYNFSFFKGMKESECVVSDKFEVAGHEWVRWQSSSTTAGQHQYNCKYSTAAVWHWQQHLLLQELAIPTKQSLSTHASHTTTANFSIAVIMAAVPVPAADSARCLLCKLKYYLYYTNS
jgi:hypothetical protein